MNWKAVAIAVFYLGAACAPMFILSYMVAYDHAPSIIEQLEK